MNTTTMPPVFRITIPARHGAASLEMSITPTVMALLRALDAKPDGVTMEELESVLDVRAEMRGGVGGRSGDAALARLRDLGLIRPCRWVLTDDGCDVLEEIERREHAEARRMAELARAAMEGSTP